MAIRFKDTISINEEYTFPSQDGTADQILATDGAGNISFVDVAGGEAVKIECKNTSGSTITKGTPVYVTGTVGTSFRVEIAPADASDSAKMPAVGLLETDLANNGEGYVITGGLLKNLTTDPIDGTNTTSNDTIYVKAGGGLTMTKPTGSNLIQNVGKVGRVNTANAGSIVVSSILRTNDIPNLTEGKIWVGSANNTIESTVVHIDETNTRVGIGTNNPQTMLDLASNNNLGTAGNILRFTDTDPTAVTNAEIGKIEFYSTDTSAVVASIVGRNTDASPSGYLTFNTAQSSTISERMRITNTGDIAMDTDTLYVDAVNNRVGIGTASPSNNLSIVDSGNTTLEINGQGRVNSLTLGVTSSESKLFENSNNALAFGTNAIERMRIDSSGSVISGYGTTSGNYQFTGSAYKIEGGSNFGDLRFTSPRFRFYEGASFAFGTDGSGNVGINTTTPNHKLEIYGGSGAGTYNLFRAYSYNGTTNKRVEINIDNTETDPIAIWNTTRSGGAVVEHSFQIDSSEKVRIDSSGNVGIGEVSPSYKLDVNGNVKLDYSLIGRGIRSANRGEFHLNSTGAADVAEMFFGYGSGYTDANIRWGISDRGSADDRLVFYKGPYHGGFTEMFTIKSTGEAQFGNSVWVNTNGSVNYNGYNENIRLFNAANGVSTIAFGASGASGQPTTSILGYSDRFETRFGSQWQTRVYNGYAMAYGSYRAPIFYDSDNTNYYVNPNGTSKFETINIFDSASTHGVLHTSDAYHGLTMRGYPNTANSLAMTAGDYMSFWEYGGIFRFYKKQPSVLTLQAWIDNGSINAITDARAPIFYDSDDTNYYMDPSSNSAAGLRTASGQLVSLYQASWSIGPSHYVLYNAWTSGTGDYLLVKGSGNQSGGNGAIIIGENGVYYGQHGNAQGAVDSSTAPLATNWGYLNSQGLHIGNTSNQYIGRNGNYTRIQTPSGYIDIGAGNSSFAHITTDRPEFYFDEPVAFDGNIRGYGGTETASFATYYDSNNTAYYADPASRSNLSSLVVGSTAANTANYGIDMYEDMHMHGYQINYVDQLHFSDNVRFYDNSDDSFLNFKYGDTAIGAIKFINGSAATTGYLYASTSGFGLLPPDGTWGVQVTNSYTQINHETRSPIFYDSDNTSYYVNPNSTSVLEAGRFGLTAGSWGSVYIATNTNAGWGSSGAYPHIGSTGGGTGSLIMLHNPHIPFRTDNPRSGATGRAGIRCTIDTSASNWWDIGLYGDAFEIYRNASGQQMFHVDNAGNSYSYASSRAPIFYDSNDTTYYVNPAGDSYNLGLSRALAEVAGWVVAYGGYNENYAQWIETEDATQLYGYGDTSVGMAHRARRVKSGQTVRFTITLKSSVAVTSGLYLRLQVYNGNLPDGKTHVSNAASASSPFVQEDSAQVTSWYENGALGTSWQTEYFEYTATADCYISLLVLNWSGAGTARFYVKTPDIQTVESPAGSTYTNFYWASDTNYGLIGNDARFDTVDSGLTTDPLELVYSRGTEVRIGSGGGTKPIKASVFYEGANTAYYLDPAASGDSIRVAGDVVAYYSSDKRLKNNIIKINSALDKVNAIGGYTFEWNEESHKETGSKDIGVIAQEVEEIFPEIVQTRSNGYKAVNYEKLVPLLIEAIKELSEKVKILENK